MYLMPSWTNWCARQINFRLLRCMNCKQKTENREVQSEIRGYPIIRLKVGNGTQGGGEITKYLIRGETLVVMGGLLTHSLIWSALLAHYLRSSQDLLPEWRCFQRGSQLHEDSLPILLSLLGQTTLDLKHSTSEQPVRCNIQYLPQNAPVWGISIPLSIVRICKNERISDCRSIHWPQTNLI